ncbi:MAG: hypothetical protein WCD11_31015, partial [Solirubrobacteraceae bacterium]
MRRKTRRPGAPATISSLVRTQFGSLRWQFALVVAIVVAPVLIALVVGGTLMVVSDRSAALV